MHLKLLLSRGDAEKQNDRCQAPGQSSGEGRLKGSSINGAPDDASAIPHDALWVLRVGSRTCVLSTPTLRLPQLWPNDVLLGRIVHPSTRSSQQLSQLAQGEEESE